MHTEAWEPLEEIIQAIGNENIPRLQVPVTSTPFSPQKKASWNASERDVLMGMTMNLHKFIKMHTLLLTWLLYFLLMINAWQKS